MYIQSGWSPLWSVAGKNRPRRPPGSVRIIGGRWRSRRLSFPDAPALRPSPDRVRVTLFNWLAPVVPGARCLDLFAGSGCLGLEALSRGAREVVFVEHDPSVATTLRNNVAQLGAEGASVVEANALSFLQQPGDPFDIVFVDPPFSSGLMDQALAALSTRGWLRPSALVYAESDVAARPAVVEGLEVIRDKSAGGVRYRLLARCPL
ncbi:MAG: 16S rRNA (guanine(966)-N(2))-methyltransferase RsmD [Acidiferrobacteraceae bacterium]